MQLTHLSIKNFRGIEELSLPLDDLCVFIGVNNAGKSSILDAIRICLTRPLANKKSVFSRYDFHLADAASSPEEAPPIEIKLTFAERFKNEWPNEMSQMLRDAVQPGGGLGKIILQVTGNFDIRIKDFVSDYFFLDRFGEPLTKAKSPRLVIALQRLAPAFYLASLRDAEKNFKPTRNSGGPLSRVLI